MWVAAEEAPEEGNSCVTAVSLNTQHRRNNQLVFRHSLNSKDKTAVM
jgi:hypothetical protein